MDQVLARQAVKALYAVPPERFVSARNELAATLKSDGEPDAAKQVAALRKPSVAAWAVDSIARDRGRELQTLIEAGEELAFAQRAVAAGGDVDRWREAVDRRRRLVDQLVRAAERVLQSADMPSARATLDKVTDTLMAIATDPEAAERVRNGVLDKELPAPAGFGDERLDAALLASVSELGKPSTVVRSSKRSDPSQAQKRTGRERERAERLAAEALKAEAEASLLEREAKGVHAKAAAATRAAQAARRRADAARRRADD